MYRGTFRWMLLINLTLLFGAVALGWSLAWAFFLIVLSSLFLLTQKGLLFSDLLQMMKKSLVDIGEILLLILFLGAFIALMIASGVVPTMIHFSAGLLQPPVFLFLSFLVVALMSVLVGTALGTLSTLGLVILALGKGYGYPPGLLVGVLVSGAFVADVASPISGLLRLTLKSYRTTYRRTLGAMAPSLVAALVVSGGLYLFLDASGQAAQLDPALILALEEHFLLTPWLWLLPLAVLVMAASGLSTLWAIGIGVGLSLLATIFVQGVDLLTILRTIFFGFSMEAAPLSTLLMSGGILGMLEVLVIVAGSVLMTTLLSATGELERTLRLVMGPYRGEGSFHRRLQVLCAFTTMATCDQTVAIVLPAKAFENTFEKRALRSDRLAASVAASGIVLAPLFAWNVNALVITGLTGVSALAYGPYTFFPLFFFLFAQAMTLRIPRKER